MASRRGHKWSAVFTRSIKVEAVAKMSPSCLGRVFSTAHSIVISYETSDALCIGNS
jgi:hypothetical protein